MVAIGVFGPESLVSGISMIVSFGSVIISVISLRLGRGQAWAATLSQISDRLETSEMRTIRRDVVYPYRSNEPARALHSEPAADAERRAIDRWGAEMDILAALSHSGTVNAVLLFETYGDVVLRTGWQLAPYGNNERARRGDQFWLPFQDLLLTHLQLWHKRGRRGVYPRSIALRYSNESISPQRMLQDREVRRFLQANGRHIRLKILQNLMNVHADTQ